MATKFEWGWNDSKLQADNLMTRQRAARLLSAWRRTSRQYQNGTRPDRLPPARAAD